jgi:hypothetical protein
VQRSEGLVLSHYDKESDHFAALHFRLLFQITMIKIIRKGPLGTTIITVTRGAYENVYSKQGYVPFEESERDMSEQEKNTSELSEDEQFVLEMETKPLSLWSNKELKRYAEMIGMDVKDKDLRAAIKAKLENATN